MFLLTMSKIRYMNVKLQQMIATEYVKLCFLISYTAGRTTRPAELSEGTHFTNR